MGRSTDPQTPPMQRSVAFLRAINVGGHTVKMDRLRALFAALGFSNVATFIASGNVVFDSEAADAGTLEARIERHLRESLGYDVATFIRSPAELDAIVRYRPFPAIGPGEGLYVAFLQTAPAEEAQRALMECGSETDDFHVHGREVYWHCRTRLSDSPFSGARLERTLGLAATLRNMNTVRRIAAKYPPAV